MEQAKTNTVLFQEIFTKLQEQIERFAKNNVELEQIGNKFMDDSGEILKEADRDKKDGGHPGLLKELNQCLDKLQALNSFYGRQLSKLQNII